MGYPSEIERITCGTRAEASILLLLKITSLSSSSESGNADRCLLSSMTSYFAISILS